MTVLKTAAIPSSPASRGFLSGTEGYALIRDGKVVAVSVASRS